MKSIGLHATEELIAVKGKKRLVILLSEENSIAEDIAGLVARDRKIHERSFVCIPLYGVHRGEGERGFPSIVLGRIGSLMYNQFFYFPPYPPEGENPIVYEAVGRLDRLQTFHRDTLAADPLRYALHDDCLHVLREWVRGYLTGEIDGHIAELRTELIGELYR